MSSRRDFLRSSAGLAGTLAVGSWAAQAAPAVTLPTVRFGGVEISRMLIGCNQFNGYSHFNSLLDKLMVDW